MLTHTCRDLADLKFSEELIHATKNDMLVGEQAQKKLHYYPTTTREKSNKMGRVTTLLEGGILFKELGLTNFNSINDRAMVCGSVGLNTDIKRILEKYGLKEGANSDPVITSSKKPLWASSRQKVQTIYFSTIINTFMH